MAESFISVFLEPVKGKLSSLISDEFQLLWGVKQDLEKLFSLLSTIQCVLQDAEERQVHSDENQVRDWLSKLKDAVYDADDVLDEFATEALRLKAEGEIQTTIFSSFPRFMYWTVRNFCCSCFCSVLFRREIAHKITEINERFDRIAKQRNDLHLREGGGLRRPLKIRYTASFVDESGIFGRENDKEKLINLLLSDGSAAKELTVIPIVGIGGLGKTTIAQLIFNDVRVKEHFAIRGWVCVSENFDLKRLIKAIIESTSWRSSDYEELSSLVEELLRTVNGKKFLLVLDDVWNEDSDWWEVLRAPLRYGAKGSKVIVTTRSPRVSSIMGTIPKYELGLLSDEDCWLLLGSYAFRNRSWDETPYLVTVGKEIAKKCKGLPLAAKTLGGLLFFMRNEREWEDILTSEMWELPGGGSYDILGSLRLSYHHLPSHLKQCFMYCAIFPKDHEFNKDKLVKMWMAEGFIMSKRAQREMEDVGSEYFDELLLRSFFQCEKGWGGRLIYKMQALIHDLAQLVSEGDCFRMDGHKKIHSFEKTRHLSCFTCAENDLKIFTCAENDLKIFRECKRLHTLLVFLEVSFRRAPDNLFQQIKFLRVLDFSGAHVRELPDSIGNLNHLRYLGLSLTEIKRVPESTCNLYNLQTLDVSHCLNFVEFPKNIRKLINLRHLIFHPFHLMTLRIGGLTCLRTLSEFVVGKESGYEIGQLMRLTNLRGELNISKLQNVDSAKRESTVTVLKDIKNIEKLNLYWDDDDNDAISSVEEEKQRTLEILEPRPENLRKLRIRGYNGVSFPSWIGNPSFSELVEISLINCRSCETIPMLGQLPSLEKLKIWGMDKVRYVGPEFCGVDDGAMINSSGRPPAFPSLKELSMKSIQNLVEWGGTEEGDFPFLQTLSIMACESLTSLPKGFKNLISLQILSIWDCERLATLPKEGLPTSLQSLYIQRCPLLVQRCRKEHGGEDWPKISHIPYLTIE